MIYAMLRYAILYDVVYEMKDFLSNKSCKLASLNVFVQNDDRIDYGLTILSRTESDKQARNL